MSYRNVRNEKGISEKRSVFGSAKGFSDVLCTAQSTDFGGGCFFGEFADVPENGCRLSLNMAPCGTALETRGDHTLMDVSRAKRYVPLHDLLYGLRAARISTVGNSSVSDVYGADGAHAGFAVTCNFFAAEGGTYTAPGVFISATLASGRYLFRLCLGEGACPHLKIYEGSDTVYFDGKPDVLADSAGARYVQAEFETAKYIRIELTYEKGSAETQTHTFARAMIVDTGAAVALGMAQETANAVLFGGESTFYTVELAIPEGRNDAEFFADGVYAFKKGSCFYTGKAGGEYFLESSALPAEGRCALFRRGGGFTVICENGQTLTTDDEVPCLGAVESEVYVPLHYRLYDSGGETENTKQEELNMFSEYFFVQMLPGTGNTCILPEELAVDGDFCEAYGPSDMSLLPEGSVTLSAGEEGGGTLTENSTHYGIIVKLRLRGESGVGAEIAKCRELLFAPAGSEIFPAKDGGHGVILYGGAEEKLFAAAALTGEMYAPREKLLLAQNTEKITSVLRYSENFLVFSPHYIRKMILSESEEGIFSCTMENFKYDMGCDIPGSAVCADDKIIYANSRAGVFYINRFGFTEKDMSRHVSANIETGENGLLVCPEAELEAAEAAVCGGKYFLRVGDFFYVWDFAHAVPSASTAKAEEERKLRWFMYSGLPCRKILGADGEMLYFLTEEHELAGVSSATSLSSSAESYFRSREYALAPFSAATVWKLSLSLAAKENCTVRLYFDGEEGSTKYTLTPEAEQSTLCIVRPEARKCRRFAFSVHSFGGMRLDGTQVEWLEG
ncbi:MAG: hypothetical protein IJW21_08345 [Clostridia bacterium]|nr:hypothetical protein [Clostridia bacterium]